MAAGDRKIRLQQLTIPRPPAGGDMVAEIRYLLFVEDKVASDKEAGGGNLSLNIGPWSTAQSVTLGTIMANAITALNANATVPAHDSAS